MAAGIEPKWQSQATVRPLGSLLFRFSALQIPIRCGLDDAQAAAFLHLTVSPANR